MNVLLETRGISKFYPGTKALKEVNYKVYRKKVNVLVGENGAGKSTMMNILSGVIIPTEGEILLEERPFFFIMSKMQRKKESESFFRNSIYIQNYP